MVWEGAKVLTLLGPRQTARPCPKACCCRVGTLRAVSGETSGVLCVVSKRRYSRARVGYIRDEKRSMPWHSIGQQQDQGGWLAARLPNSAVATKETQVKRLGFGAVP
jgi:hypothetical protein